MLFVTQRDFAVASWVFPPWNEVMTVPDESEREGKGGAYCDPQFSRGGRKKLQKKCILSVQQNFIRYSVY